MGTKDDFRSVLGQFATGVTIITTAVDDEPHGMTANSFTSLSIDPPLILFNADKGTKTHEYVKNSERFAVNILTTEQQWISDRFAGKHHEMDDPFHDIGFTRGTTGSPLLDDSLGYLDCELYERFPGGDHTIYVGEVIDLKLVNPNAPALTFFRSKYGSLE